MEDSAASKAEKMQKRTQPRAEICPLSSRPRRRTTALTETRNSLRGLSRASNAKNAKTNSSLSPRRPGAALLKPRGLALGMKSIRKFAKTNLPPPLKPPS